MLKLTVKAGEYLLIGKDIKVIYTGGSANSGHFLIEAPKEVNIARSSAYEKKYGIAPDSNIIVKHYKDRELSPEAKEKIRAVMIEERRKAKRAEAAENPQKKYGGI